jgi:hypothetical protein
LRYLELHGKQGRGERGEVRRLSAIPHLAPQSTEHPAYLLELLLNLTI